MRGVILRSLAVLLAGSAVLAGILYVASTVDSRPPLVSSVELTQHLAADASVALTTTSIEVTFSEAVDHTSAEDAVAIEPAVAGSFSWSATTLTFTPADPLPLDAEFRVTIAAGVRDRAGNAMSDPAQPFAFATVGSPRVVATNPLEAATDVPLDVMVQITFSTLMDTASVEAAITMQPALPYHLRWSGERLTIIPDVPLPAGAAVRVGIGQDARDLGGTRLDASLALSFSTIRGGLEADLLLPAAGTAGIAVTTAIGVIFNAPIDPRSVTQEVMTITPSVAGSLEAMALPGAAGLTDADARLLRFVPSAPLPANTTFEVVVARDLRTIDGVQLAAELTWSFTTGSPSATLSNQVVFLSDRSGITNLWAMNPDGTNQRQVTAELSAVTDYAVAPDGRSLIVGDGAQLVEQLADGRDRRVLTDGGALEFDPVYSPDGRAIAFGRADATTGGGLGIWQRGVRGGDATRLAIESGGSSPSATPSPSTSSAPPAERLLREPAYASDGSALAYVDTAGAVGIYDFDSGNLASAAFDATAAPTWVPDGSALLLSGNRRRAAPDPDRAPRHPARTPVLPLGPSDGLRPEGVRLTVGSTSVIPGSFVDGARAFAVAEGGRVAYVAASDGPSGPIWLVTGGQARMLGDAGLTADWVSFTPEPGKLVIERTAADGAPGIWLVALGDGHAQQLAEGGRRPRWLP